MSRELKALALGYVFSAPICIAMCRLPKNVSDSLLGVLSGMVIGFWCYFLAFWLLGKPWRSPKP